MENNKPRDIDNRGQKSVDVASTSTSTQVLIGLASGIIVAILGLYPTLLTIQYFNFYLLKVALALIGSSLVFGLFALGSLITAISEYTLPIPPSKRRVNLVAMFQFLLFAGGILLMIYILPVTATLAK